MFTGLVHGVARIVEVLPQGNGGGRQLRVDAGTVPGFRAAAGDSIALNGACLTAITVDGACFSAQVSEETLARTAGLDRPGEVNLETALRLGDALGGHLVAGHIDAVGVVISMTALAASWQLDVRAPAELGRFIAPKGSVTIDGVSLTVNRLSDGPNGCEFSVSIIPHTHAVTTLGGLTAGSRVNLEVDLIARHVERLLAHAGGLRRD